MKKIVMKVYNKVWWTIILFQPALIVIISLLLKNTSLQFRSNFMIGLYAFELIYLLIYKVVMVSTCPDSYLWDELPFYICNISSFFGLFGAIFHINALMSFCFSLGSVGALMALLMPDGKFLEAPITSVKIWGYYGYHGLILVSGFLFVTLGVYIPEYKDVWKLLLVCLIMICSVHLVNIILRKTVFPEANYSFTFGGRGNFVLDKMKSIFKINCVYLFPLLIVVAGVFILFTAITKLF